MSDFVECDTCRAKPGSPTLCSGCLANRATISALRAALIEACDLYDRTAAGALFDVERIAELRKLVK